ncbi:MAG: dihydropteroate synthase [Elusimicrobia bacterium]|nr:dihydropteroate synthase [Elusimicrobiota bacterium]
MTATANLAGVMIGPGHPVRILGVINVSPESFYKASVSGKRSVQKTARELEEKGADFIDIGAMSTAPYLTTAVSEQEEAERIGWAVAAARAACRLPISVDTSRPLPAAAGLKAGADILNDITGLQGGEPIERIARRCRGVILMAHPSAYTGTVFPNPVLTVKKILSGALKRAAKAGLHGDRVLIDPGIGFFRNTHIDWWQWDLAILRSLRQIAAMPAPVMVGVSRKSFVSQLLDNRPPEERLFGSIGATVTAVLNGAAVVRTHDVAETRDAVRVAQAIQVERVSFRGTDGVRKAVPVRATRR